MAIITTSNIGSAGILAQTAGRSPADQSLTSQTALQDATGHSFPIGANEEWIVQFDLDIGAVLSTTGLKIAANAPAGATINFDVELGQIVVAAANVVYGETTTVAGAITLAAATLVSITNAGCIANLWVLNGSTAGTVQLQFAQATSSGTALTLKRGSSFFAFRVA